MTQQIIVGIDHAARTQTALDWALRRADQLKVPVALVHVMNDLPNLYDYGHYDHLVHDAKALLENLTTHARETFPDVAVSTELLTGGVVKSLSELSGDADLLVVGTDKTHRFIGQVFTGVGLQLAAVSTCPLVVVPGTVREDGTGVVVGVDGSAGARVAVEAAAAEAVRAAQQLNVVYVYQVPEWILEDAEHETSAREIEEEAQTVLAESVHGINDLHPQLKIHRKVVAHNSPATALIMEAQSAQLLVVGNRGRGRLKSLLLGSVGHDLLNYTPCPTMVTRHRQQHGTG